jgi:hypothetical protein
MSTILGFFGNPTFVEAASTFAAAIAAIFSFFVAYQANRQSKGSVRPLPFVMIGDFENDLSVSIHNFGVGPLIIEKLEVTNSQIGEARGNIIEFMPDLIDGEAWDNFVQDNIVGRPIAPGGSMRLVRYLGDNPQNIKSIREALSRLTVTVIVSDVFGKKMPACSRALTYFARQAHFRHVS